MKVVIISDTHFGDDNCKLVIKNGGKITIGPKYNMLKEIAGYNNDFMVLNGDVLDFSISPYNDAYEYAQVFFRKVIEDELAKQFIYLAGNHDADIWHIIQHQRHVINKIINGGIPESYQHSIAGIIDDRIGSACHGFRLNEVTSKIGNIKYGGMFLDGIAKGAIFNFAYPNLYIIPDSGNECVLVTHGHYLELYWAIMKEIVTEVAYDDLRMGKPSGLSKLGFKK